MARSSTLKRKRDPEQEKAAVLEWTAAKSRYARNQLAQRIRAIVLPTFAGYTVLQAIGPSACVLIAEALSPPQP